jgi:hypothetical protein
MKRFPQPRAAVLLVPSLFAALVASGGFATTASAQTTSNEFKFPAVLCVYRYSMVSAQNATGASIGSNELYGFDTGEQALRTQNIQNGSGEISAEYPISDTPYRFRFEGKVIQNLHVASASGATDELQIRTFLEKKDPSTGNYVLVGQKSTTVDATESAGGIVNKNVYARAANREMDAYRDANGKIDPAKVEQGIQAGKLAAGTVFNAGPICGLMDMRTVKQVTNHGAELADLLSQVPDPAPVFALNSAVNQKLPAPPASARPSEAAVNEETSNPSEFDQAYPELAAQSPEALEANAPAASEKAAQQKQDQELAKAEADARMQLAQQNGEAPLLNDVALAGAAAPTASPGSPSAEETAALTEPEPESELPPPQPTAAPLGAVAQTHRNTF